VAKTSLISQKVRSPAMVLPVELLVLLGIFLISLLLGAKEIPISTVYEAFFAYDGSEAHLIVTTVRLPRSLVAMLVGSSLAVAGAIMQSITRNPLASPVILGVNAGAALAVVLSASVWGFSSLSTYIWLALLGAAVTAIAVYTFSSFGQGGATYFNITIAGAAMAALMSSLTTAVLVLNQRTLDEIRFWLVGSTAGRDFDLIVQVLPYLSVGLVLALALRRQLTTLSLGTEIAQGLGQKTVWIQMAAATSVVLLAGGSVAIAGPIGFIGLIVPHLTRFLVGWDYRKIVPHAALLGAILLLLSDIVARVAVRPQELPVGLVTPLVGAPFFIYLVRAKLR
jgi:iron complex transport system permease protein